MIPGFAASVFVVTAGVALAVSAVYFGLPWLIVLVPLLTLVAGACVVSLAVFGRSQRTPDESQVGAESAADKVFQHRAERLRPLLALDSPSMTVERLVLESAMSEDAVVETLGGLVERGDVDEELNVETGEWYYRLEPEVSAGQRPQNLNERRAQLAQKRGERS